MVILHHSNLQLYEFRHVSLTDASKTLHSSFPLVNPPQNRCKCSPWSEPANRVPERLFSSVKSYIVAFRDCQVVHIGTSPASQIKKAPASHNAEAPPLNKYMSYGPNKDMRNLSLILFKQPVRESPRQNITPMAVIRLAALLPHIRILYSLVITIAF